jgi:hypothetical protein
VLPKATGPAQVAPGRLRGAQRAEAKRLSSVLMVVILTRLGVLAGVRLAILASNK